MVSTPLLTEVREAVNKREWRRKISYNIQPSEATYLSHGKYLSLFISWIPFPFRVAHGLLRIVIAERRGTTWVSGTKIEQL
jgi:hypothetical protein